MQKLRAFFVLVLTLAVVAVFAVAQNGSTPAPKPEPSKSVEIHPDGTVTFHFKAPNAKEVTVSREGLKPEPMQQEDNGWWTITTPPLTPDIYGYTISVDGVALFDPLNPRVVPNLLYVANSFIIPGAQPWEVADVPHGQLHRHFFKSEIVGDQRDFIVYTPAAYDKNPKQKFPVLYLLHGFSDDASGWTAVGQAHVILDNLIASGKAKPMIVVMPLGYGAPEILDRTFHSWDNDELRNRNFTRFTESLLKEVKPRVEQSYRVSTKRTDRAIAGLSMGGSETLLTGLNNLDTFAYVAAFSSGGLGTEFDKRFPNLDAKAVNQNLKLLWVSCGTEDSLIKPNRQLVQWLKGKQINVNDVETGGSHTWLVWRRNLAEVAQKLFQN